MTVDPRTAERIDAVGRWVAARGGSATPGEVGAALGLDSNQQAAAVRGLRAGRLAKPGRSLVELTPLGLARFGGMEHGSAGRVLDEVLNGWPAGHYAFVELAVCAVIARHHLRAERPSPHVGFMAVGGTGAGKSASGVLVCQLFGLDPIAATRQMPTMTENPLGRRAQIEGGNWVFQPSALARQPFALLDELDKADAAVQKAVWPVFDGSTTLFIEDAAQDIAPTPMVTANPPGRGTDRLQNLPEHARRRSVVLDVGSASDYTREDVRRFGDVYEHQLAPNQRLSLEALRPPAALSPVTREWIEEAREQFLTDKGREEFPGVAALELLTRGRLSMLGGQVSEQVAAAHTFAAYLTVTETIPGQVNPDGAWAQVMGDYCRENPEYGGAQALLAAVARFSTARVAADAQAIRGKRAKARADDAVLEGAAVLVSRCNQPYLALDGHGLTFASRAQKDEAKGIRKLLGSYRGRAGKISTAKGLAELTDLAKDPIERAWKLRAQLDQVRADADQAVKDAKDEVRQNREANQRATTAVATQVTRHLANQRTVLKQVRAKIKELDALHRRVTTRPDENPLQRLSELQLVRLWQGPIPAPRPGWRGLIPQRRPGGWAITGTSTTLDGSQLRSWGPGTQAALEPALTFLRVQEANLVQELADAKPTRPNASSSQRRAIEARRN